jgi:ASC-1-like (ASCH) protein
MNELEMTLSIDTIRALLDGQSIVFDLEEEKVRVIINCDIRAITSFREHINRAMLELLPAPPGIN